MARLVSLSRIAHRRASLCARIELPSVDTRRADCERRKATVEATRAAYLLKKCRENPDEQMKTTVSRLLREDLVTTLDVLKGQGEVDLAIKVFNHIRKQAWYKPSRNQFNSMLKFVGKHKRLDSFAELLDELKKEGLEPLKDMFSYPIKDCMLDDDSETAMKLYELMKSSGCPRDTSFYRGLIIKLEKAGQAEFLEIVKKDHREHQRINRDDKERSSTLGSQFQF